ncbi:G-protein coupled receptor 35-like [Varanus komodoensis]|uniref:G-protein coupled receptor 35-like n=1 Tax=Varanus komodoensis TaxID=61221 RepID=UPI001CF778BA|nr:G-protein coupled receptor 35-like [Varanus komodoensis]
MVQNMNHEETCSTITNNTIDLTQAIIYVPVFFTGLILNALALRVFCCKLNKWTETRIYMTNLAIADCFFIFTLPFMLIYKSGSVDTVCLVLESSYFINRYMSIFLITITAIDRYIAITYPLKAKNVRSPVKSAIVCGLLWILIITILCATKMVDQRETGSICFKKVSRAPSWNIFAAVIWGFLIPLTFLSFCSIQTVKKLRRKKNIQPHEEKLIQKAINIIIANMAVFIICFLPIHLAYLIRFIADAKQVSCTTTEKIDIFVNLAGILANTNCCLDVICYYFVNKEFQEASMELTTKYVSHKNQSSANEVSEII